MALTSFRKVRTANTELDQLQSNSEAVFKDIVRRLVLDGQLLKDISLTTGQTNSVDHKLQRKLVGYFLVGNSANSVVYDSQASNQTPDLTLNLLCSANTTVSLWVF